MPKLIAAVSEHRTFLAHLNNVRKLAQFIVMFADIIGALGHGHYSVQVRAPHLSNEDIFRLEEFFLTIPTSMKKALSTRTEFETPSCASFRSRN